MIIKYVETSKVPHVLKDWLLQLKYFHVWKFNIGFKYNNWNEVAYVCVSIQ